MGKQSVDRWGRTDLTLCQRWDNGAARRGVCRNKRYGNTDLCRRHIIEDLENFERNNRALAFYLKYKDLLDA